MHWYVKGKATKVTSSRPNSEWLTRIPCARSKRGWTRCWRSCLLANLKLSEKMRGLCHAR